MIASHLQEAPELDRCANNQPQSLRRKHTNESSYNTIIFEFRGKKMSISSPL